MIILAIEANVAQAIADYLMTKPYREVAGLVAELAKLRQVDLAQPGSDGEGGSASEVPRDMIENSPT